MIKVISEVREQPDVVGPYSTLRVKSHNTDQDKVILQIDIDEEHTFLAKDLIFAIANAKNTGK